MRGAVDRLKIGSLAAETLDHAGHFGVGRVGGGDFGRKLGVIRQHELGPDIQSDRDGRGGPDGDGPLLEIHDIEHVDFFFLQPLTIGLADDLLLELLGDFLRKAARDHRGRSFAGTEAGEAGLLGEFGDHRLMFGVNLALVERDDEAFARGGETVLLDVHGSVGRQV